MSYSKHDLAFPRAKFDEYEKQIYKLKEENEDFKSIISNQSERHKTTQIKNEKIGNELNRIEDKPATIRKQLEGNLAFIASDKYNGISERTYLKLKKSIDNTFKEVTE